MKEFDLSVRGSYRTITDQELDAKCKLSNGTRTSSFNGLAHSVVENDGFHASRWCCRDLSSDLISWINHLSVHNMVKIITKCCLCLNLWPIYGFIFRHFWHLLTSNGTWHMLYVCPLLNTYNIVIFGGVNGYSRKVTNTLHATHSLNAFAESRCKMWCVFFLQILYFVLQQITEPQLHSNVFLLTS